MVVSFIKNNLPGIPISDPSGPAVLGFKIGFISVFMSYNPESQIVSTMHYIYCNKIICYIATPTPHPHKMGNIAREVCYPHPHKMGKIAREVEDKEMQD